MDMKKTIRINRDAGHVWDIVAHRFERVGEWSSGVVSSGVNPDASVPDGALVGGRVCHVPGIGDLKETFTAYSEDDKRFTFRVTGMPSFITKAQNTVTVSAAGPNAADVSLNIVMETNAIGKVMGPMFKIRVTNLLNTFLDELKAYAEEGVISAKKQKQLAKV
jgi:carbon monoxide dehydrogenase subunit G